VFLVGLAMAFWSYWGDAHPVASERRTAAFPDQARAMTGGSPINKGENPIDR
jgi:hypothetical protein